jgi:hypothetical protein
MTDFYADASGEKLKGNSGGKSEPTSELLLASS